jgi:AraC-like DNA-binding protein
MEKSQLLGSILNYLTADVLTADYTQCTEQWHEYNFIPTYSRIYYILEGEGRIEIDGREYFPKPKQICIMPAYVRQSYEAISDKGYLKYWAHFVCKSGGRSIFDIIKVPYVIDIKQDVTRERLKTIFTSMIEHYKQKTFVSNIMIESYIRELIAIYLKEAGIENITIASSKDNDRQSEILKYINDNIHEKISIDDMARALYLHPNYFIKYFKKAFGISPARYINKKKIELACEMLGNEKINISEISSDLGYSDIYHFSKVFKKHTGFPPSYYRRYIAKIE